MKIRLRQAALFAALLLFGFMPAKPLQAADDNAGWTEDMPMALTQAKAEKRLVFVDFTGSDWCPACKILDKELFSDPAFKQYAQDHLVLVRLDFPREAPQDPAVRKRNQQLVMQYNPDGIFPMFLVLDADGKILTADEGYKPGTAKDLIENLKKVKG